MTSTFKMIKIAGVFTAVAFASGAMAQSAATQTLSDAFTAPLTITESGVLHTTRLTDNVKGFDLATQAELNTVANRTQNQSAEGSKTTFTGVVEASGVFVNNGANGSGVITAAGNNLMVNATTGNLVLTPGPNGTINADGNTRVAGTLRVGDEQLTRAGTYGAGVTTSVETARGSNVSTGTIVVHADNGQFTQINGAGLNTGAVTTGSVTTSDVRVNTGDASYGATITTTRDGLIVDNRGDVGSVAINGGGSITIINNSNDPSVTLSASNGNLTVNGVAVNTAGVKGTDGRDGAQGLQGERGLQGLTGAQGIQGERGFTGATGAQGIQGVQGERGADGQDAVISINAKGQYEVRDAGGRVVAVATAAEAEALRTGLADEAKSRRTADEALQLAIAKEEFARTAADNKLDEMVRTETTRAMAEEQRIDTRLTKEVARLDGRVDAVNKRVDNHAKTAGAIAVNTLGNALLPETVKAEGISVYATTTSVGVSKQMDGYSVSVDNNGVGVSKSYDVNENIRLQGTLGTNSSVGAFAHVNGNGVGVSNFGASVMIENHVIPLTPQGFVVAAVSGAINSVTGKTAAKINALQADNTMLKQQLATQAVEMAELKAAVAALVAAQAK